MKTITQYLENLPKPVLSKLHRNHCQAKGLVSNAKVLSETAAWACSTHRIVEQFEHWNEVQKHILIQIYLQKGRGIRFSALLQNLPETDRFLLKYTLKEFYFHLVIFKSDDSDPILFGFEDFSPLFLERAPTIPAIEANLKSWDYSCYFISHLLQTLGTLKRQPWKLSKSHQPLQRQVQYLTKYWTQGNKLHQDIAIEEFHFIWELLKEKEILVQEKEFTHIQLPTEWNTKSLWKESVSLWCKTKLHWSIDTLIQFLKDSQKWDATFVLDCWRIDGETSHIEESFAWNKLPKPLKQAWFLGLVSFDLDGENIHRVNPTELALSFNEPNLPPPTLYFTPNFELYLSIGELDEKILDLFLIGEPVNDERMLQLRIDKKFFEDSVRQHLDLSRLLANHTEIPSLIKQTLQEWYSSIRVCTWQEGIFLEISNTTILNSISQHPKLKPYIFKVIHNIGILCDSSKANLFQEVLKQFEINPYFLKQEDIEIKIFEKKWKEQVEYEVEYEIREPSKKPPLKLGELSKYGGQFRELDYSQRMRVIEFCLLTESKIEIIWNDEGKKQCVFIPIRLHTESAPIFFEGEEEASKKNRQIELDKISTLRVMN